MICNAGSGGGRAGPEGAVFGQASYSSKLFSSREKAPELFGGAGNGWELGTIFFHRPLKVDNPRNQKPILKKSSPRQRGQERDDIRPHPGGSDKVFRSMDTAFIVAPSMK